MSRADGMAYRIQLSRPSLTKQEAEAVASAVTSGWISDGGWHEEACSLLRKRTGRRYCLLTSSGTMALSAAAASVGINSQSRVAVPILCFPGVAQAIPGTPVAIDVDPNWQLDVPHLRTLGPPVDACIAVDTYGGLPDYDALEPCCHGLGIPLIEDAAEAFGAFHRGRPSGSFGDVSVFSFFANKILTSGQGGALLTDNPILYERARAYIDFGRAGSKAYHEHRGTNGGMTEMQAALLATQLTRADELLAGRRAAAFWYNELLPPTEDCQGQSVASNQTWAPWLRSIRLRPGNRGEVMEALRSEGIESRPFFPLLTMHRGFQVEDRHQYLTAADIAAGGLCLPLFPELTRSEVEEISFIVRAHVRKEAA